MVRELAYSTLLSPLFESLDVDTGGRHVMAKKGKIRYFYIEKIQAPAANILKQDALSIGAEVAVPKSVVVCGEPSVDALLMCTDKQLAILAKKELSQPFGLKHIAKELGVYLPSPQKSPQIMGILNVTNESFYEKSRVDAHSFYQTFERMIADGATIIDIGAVSSKPGSSLMSQEEELARLEPIFKMIQETQASSLVTLSLDTFRPDVAHKALDYGFHIINDITGLANDKMVDVLAHYPDVQAIIMHMQGEPQTMQNNPHYTHLIEEITTFFDQRIAKATQKGVKNLILDIGIGFGKTTEHNYALLANLPTFHRFGLPLLVGASRKSLINAISPSDVEQRLGGTLAIHLHALSCGANIIRCHDVFEHVQALQITQKIQNSY